MMDAYSSVGMPINYPHWSFGKKFIETERLYKHGQQGLAYEIVINSNPCIGLPDGREHHHHASAGHGARLLRTQLLF
ncbi:Stage V sporulation protein involved in spore cortex synthesis (SpoVR) [Salmonella enterica subsp. enterica]|nr:Stage V sporulation protein involved in spore cortex synthesis (SpoVR) [Salmonella enterica subsp. enterica]